MDPKFDAPSFTLPVMQGFVELNQCKTNDKSFAWGLIIRRSRHRPGLRYFSHGRDVSNSTVLISGVCFAIKHGDELIRWPRIVKLPSTDDISKADFTEKGNMSLPQITKEELASL
ncbi:hypothetical protein HMPREF1544_03449 [Mucor circinelloides 1006PhL]|uniref:SAC domain-containing protein n=1 Tax=Mucor circinelloides f. circinelloides (strain 1006PhL) TaxID=1220926 RepID=S2JHH1_MUCC1|nr:hypothetical protein HMPREF1544_03449 [Mucor circinelloides 1006PhL]